ncbi:phage tail tape measure protein [Mycolicibacterium peregrinum]
MPELSTAWITLAVSADGMKRDITKALNQAERGAKISPKVDTSKMSNEADSAGRRFGSRFSASAKLDPKVNTSGIAAQGDKAGKDFGSRFSTGAKTALATVGLAGGIAGLASQFKAVMSVGMDWTNNMNTLTAVTGASAAELKRAGDAARALGNDISLPATSANDAASAMTELAKGGFTVQQAMDAAKGSLQLAAAAGISATDAATIQSQALQAFGLNANQAGKMSDTLANAANASSAEITDVAYALQAAGTVANQFGLSAEDTSAAIALLANNGIKGSDAGTLLKSSLLALTDQGNPAQGAIKELGLTVYDTAGKFVGLHSLYGQLGEAAKRMTPEQYQAATAVLFGSDAMRIAGVAAKDGSKSYDNMRVAIDRQGAAADVAAAKTKGLPGAWERFKNTLESLQLQAYDKLEGPLTKLIDGVAKVPDTLSELARNPQVQSLIEQTKSAFGSLGDSVKGAAPALGEIAKSLGTAAAAIGGAAWKAFVTTLETVASAVRVITPALKTVGDLMSAHQGLVTAAVAAWLGFKAIPGIMGAVTPKLKSVNDAVASIGTGAKNTVGGVRNLADTYRTSVNWMRQSNPTVSTAGRVLFGMGSNAQTASAHLRVLSTNARNAVSGGLNALKGAAGGIVGALGGPFSAALMVGAGAFAAISAGNDAATTSLNNYNEALKRSKEAQTTLNDALIASGGVMDEKALGDLQNRLGTLKGELDTAGGRTGSPLDRLRDESGSLWGGFKKQIFAFGDNPEGNLHTKIAQQADTAKAASTAIDNLSLSQENLAKQVGGDQPTFDALVSNLEKQGAGGVVAAEKMKQLRIDLLGAQQAGTVANPVLKKLSDDVVASAGRIKTAFDAVPKDAPVNVSAPGGQAVFDLLTQLGQKVSQDNEKNIHVDAPLAPEVLATLKSLGFEVTQNNDKTITVRQVGAEEASTQIDQAAKDRKVTIEAAFAGVTASGSVAIDRPTAHGERANGAIVPHVFGAIVPMADGGLQWIEKPKTAGIYAGRGAGTIFAEEETGGEAYIPLAKSKRGRSMAILMEVARLFGIGRNAEGSITVDELKSYASGISGGSYVRGGPPGLTGTDCSGAQAALANYITGAGGRFATGNESQALLARGFQQGDPPSGIAAYWIGWKNGGPGGGHTAGTILDPEGGNVNVEMGGKSGGGAFGGAAAGASEFPNRAWIPLAGYGEDPNGSSGGSSAAVKSASASVTSAKASVSSAQNALDKANADLDKLKSEGASADKQLAAEKKRDVAEQRLTAAQERQSAAETRLSEVKDKQANKAEKDTGAQGFGQQLASGLFGGVMESIGLPGFSNILDWPMVKSGQAALNAFSGPIKGALEGKLGIQQPGWSPGMPIGEEGNVVGLPGGGGELPGISLPGVGDFLKPMPDAGRQLRPNESHQGSGNQPGPVTNVKYEMNGVDPKRGLLKADAHANQTYKKTVGAVRPS